MKAQFHSRKGERGITIIVVAIVLVALLGMAALAVDIATLYVARGEAQRSADSAALTGAKVLAASGYTSSPTTWVQADLCQSGAAGLSAAANKLSEAALTSPNNPVAGQPAVLTSINCNFANQNNPYVKVSVQRMGLPTYFAKIWGNSLNSVSATATAEAYNSSGENVPVSMTGVKPWLVPNCAPIAGTGHCVSSASALIDPTTGAIQSNGSFIGTAITLSSSPGGAPAAAGRYYHLALPTSSGTRTCPDVSAPMCGDLGGASDYFYNVACHSRTALKCGDSVTIDSTPIDPDSNEATSCLIHHNGSATSQDQPAFSGPAAPVTFKGGDENPNTSLRGVNNISRSDSVVTVPIYDEVACGGTCTNAPIIGFMQLGIIDTTATVGTINAVIMNVSGCSSTATGTPVSGGGVSTVPVRLINE